MREQRLEAALRQLVNYIEGRGHHPDCLAEALGHGPTCDCGLHGTLFEARLALESR